MQDKKEPSFFFNGWEFIPFLLFATSVFFSRALLSVSVGLMLIWSILLLKKNKTIFKSIFTKTSKRLLILLCVWVLFVIFDFFRTENSTDWLTEIALKIPILIVSLYAILLPKTSCKNENSWLILVTITALTAVVSAVNYFINYQEINELLLQSKHVPIFSNMHHIYFGVYCTIAIWVSMYFYKNGTKATWWASIGIVLFVLMHILVSRTGLVSLYASIVVFLIANEWKSKRYKRLLISLIVLLCLPIVGYTVSSSFRNKVLNSLEDFNALKSQKEINYKSLAMRVEAWKTSLHVIQNNAVIGVGATNTDRYLQKQYVQDETVLYKDNRVGPHNQFLEITMAHGLMGLMLLLAFLLIWFVSIKRNPILLAVFVAFFVSLMLESFLERQQGILLFCIFVFAFIPVPSTINKETET